MGDCRDTAVVALWNQHATTFDVETYLQLGQDQPLVFLFYAVTSRMFQGKLSLQGSTLCKCCFGRLPPPAVLGPDFFQNEPERISVAQLSTFTNPHIIYNKRYIITAKIKQVVPNQSWWYLACDSCKKTVQQQGGGYKCSGADRASTAGSPRYRVPLMVVDPALPPTTSNAPSVELVFFGPTAEEIIGAPVDALIATSSSIGAFLPTKITALYGKVYELRVSVSPGSLQRINITYQVYGIIGVAHPALPAAQPDQLQQTTISVGQSSGATQQESLISSSAPTETSTKKNDQPTLLPQTEPHEGPVAAPATPAPVAVPLKQVDKGEHTTPITEASQAGSISVTTQLSNTPPPPTTPMAEQVPANTDSIKATETQGR